MYFAVNHGNEFMLFQNTLYNMPNGRRIDVIWPIEHVKGKSLTIRLSDTNENTSQIRSWNKSEDYPCSWSYTGSSMHVILNLYNLLITAPIVFMDSEYKQLLPYNSYLFIPSDIKFIEEEEHHNYTLARVYYTDPNSSENTFAIPQLRNSSAPRAPPRAPPRAATPRAAPRAATPRAATPQAAPQAATPQATPRAATPRAAPFRVTALREATAPLQTITSVAANSLPTHIIKIVLADAIRKNEVCPITSEDITETNATVTCCGHVFTTTAITHWLSLPSSRNECPVCKQKCS